MQRIMKTEDYTTQIRLVARASRAFSTLVVATLLLVIDVSAMAATVQVVVGDGGPIYTPDPVTVQVGDTVEWVWSPESRPSSVTSGVNAQWSGLFDSGVHQAPTRFSHTFESPGRFDYFCRMLNSMTGVVIVTGSQLLNISTRLQVETGEGAMIGGFIITGNASKKVIVLAKGPSLSQSGVNGVLPDPKVELNGNGGAIASNDDWKSSSQQAEIEATGVAPSDERESAIVATLAPGNYTAVVTGKNPPSGVGLVEVYDLAQPANSKLANISTRGVVGTGSNVMIGGFILGRPGGANVIVRALGPTLTQSGINGVLVDPLLDLRDGNGERIRSNNDWRDSQEAEIQATGIPPQNNLESAVVATLPPGAYTAVVAGNGDGTGVGLVEVYQLP